MSTKTLIVTGGAGFIGSNFIFHMLETDPDYRIVCLDKLTHAGNLSTLKSVMGEPGETPPAADAASPGRGGKDEIDDVAMSDNGGKDEGEHSAPLIRGAVAEGD